MDEKIRVRLKIDLSRYATGLLPGIEGITVGRQNMWSRGSDRFISVHFPGVTTLDVLWSSLEIVDKEYLKKIEEEREEFKRELKTATNVVKAIGPRGGFKGLSFEYVNNEGIHCSTSIGFKSKAENIIKILEEYGISVGIKIIQ